MNGSFTYIFLFIVDYLIRRDAPFGNSCIISDAIPINPRKIKIRKVMEFYVMKDAYELLFLVYPDWPMTSLI